jgi:hypothetical protein
MPSGSGKEKERDESNSFFFFYFFRAFSLFCLRVSRDLYARALSRCDDDDAFFFDMRENFKTHIFRVSIGKSTEVKSALRGYGYSKKKKEIHV